MNTSYGKQLAEQLVRGMRQVLSVDRYAGNYDETKHPRDQGGRFSSKSDAGGGSKKGTSGAKVVGVKVGGSHVTVHHNGSAWVSPSNGKQHSTAHDALRHEVYHTLRADGELDGVDHPDDIDLSRFGEVREYRKHADPE